MAKVFNAQLIALWVREPLPRYTDFPGEPEEEADAANEYFKGRQKEVADIAAQRGIQINACPKADIPPKPSSTPPRTAATT